MQEHLPLSLSQSEEVEPSGLHMHSKIEKYVKLTCQKYNYFFIQTLTQWIIEVIWFAFITLFTSDLRLAFITFAACESLFTLITFAACESKFTNAIASVITIQS